MEEEKERLETYGYSPIKRKNTMDTSIILENWLSLQKKIKEEITLEDICKNLFNKYLSG